MKYIELNMCGYLQGMKKYTRLKKSTKFPLKSSRKAEGKVFINRIILVITKRKEGKRVKDKDS